MLVRDISGKPLFVMDGDVGRDTSGKPVVAATGKDSLAGKLAKCAASWMSGRHVLMDLAPGDVSTPATQAVFPIPVGDYVADVASQVRFVTHASGTFYLENVADAVKLVVAEVGGTASPPVVTPGYAVTTFTTQGYALAAKLPRDVSENADWDLKAHSVQFLCNALRLGREVRVAKLLTTAANWAAANQVAVISKWNPPVATNAAPLNDLFAALAASVLPANVIVLPEKAAQFYYGNPAVGATITVMRDYVQSGGEMPRALFARAKYTVGGTPVYVWSPTLPTNVAVIRSPDSIPTSVTFRWLGDDGLDGVQRQDGMLVREYRDTSDNSDYLVVAHNDVEIMVSNQVGALLVGALA